jgi:transposase
MCDRKCFVMSSAATQNKSTNKPATAEPTPLSDQLEQLRSAMNARINAGDGQGAIETLLDIIASQHHDNAQLAKRLDAALRARFGRRSEKLTAEELGQLVLALGGTQQDAANPNAQVPVPETEETDEASSEPKGKPDRKRGSKKGRHPGRTRLDPALPRRVTLHTVPAGERNCLHCGTTMQTIGHTDHERVDYIPARIEVVVDRREKVACTTCHQDITTASRPGERMPEPQAAAADAQAAASGAAAESVSVAVDAALAPATDNPAGHALAPGAHIYRRAGASLLAHLLEAKCDDALPIYRQRQQLARLGFDVPLNTLYGYWDAASRIVEPVAEMVLSCVLGKPIVGIDDTRLDWLDPSAKGKRRRGHLWCLVGSGDLVAFTFTESWAADEVAPWIDAIDGYIQCDDYAGYSAMRTMQDGTKIELVPPERRLGCWMHVRRPFHKAFKAGEKHAIIPLGYIKDLYAVEREACDLSMTPDERLVLRQEKSQPAADAFFAWVEARQQVERPSSYIGKALHYALNQKEFAMRCLTDGRFELDTGRVERQIREPVIGRKNYLFSGSAAAASRLAGAYSLVCSCQNLGINTRAYLTDIITKLQAGFPLRDINRLRPDVWAAERSTLVTQQLAQ